MRKLAASVAAVAVLALPAIASAHSAYRNVTLDGSPWSATYIASTSTGWTKLGCWATASVNPGQTKYVRNTATETRFGLGVFTVIGGVWHVHNTWDSDVVTGAETRYFYATVDRTGLATRRVWFTEGNGLPYQRAVKFVNDSATATGHAVVVRANC